MKCSQILERVLDCDLKISGLTQDSRQVRSGSLFFCHGTGEQAKRYCEEAMNKGAAAIVCSEKMEGTIFSDDPRRDYSLACQRFWGNPQNALKLIAVTGTNGKSSVAWQLQHILNHCGKPCGLIGTICNKWGRNELPSVYTTPDAGHLYPLLAQMKEDGCTHVVMEASSHAISQQRLAGLSFELGIFTNLSREHLDQHGTMEEYFDVKQSIFTQCKYGLCNDDDQYGSIIRKNHNTASYSLYSDTADYHVCQRLSGVLGSRFCLVSKQESAYVHLDLPADFLVSNAIAALSAANMLGVPLQTAADALCSCPPIPGRSERVLCGDFEVMIDYAHSSDGIENILRLAKQLDPKNLYVVFGCAGERDRGDRQQMVQSVLSVADRAIFTADNPRNESWKQICSDVNCVDKRLEYQYDRRCAIETALGWCRKGDLLLLLGKGHENYQVLDNRTISFSEREIVSEFCKKKQVNPLK